jgi:hypothetical protein
MAMAKVALDMQKVRLAFFDAAVAGLGVFFMVAMRTPVQWTVPTVVLATIGGRLLRPGRFVRKYNQPEMASTFAPKWVELAGSRLRTHSESGVTGELPLKAVLELRRVREFLVLVLEKGEWLLVPKAAFSTVEEEGQFVEALKRTVPKVRGL